MSDTRALLVFNLATDADDPLLGFALGWLNLLATHYDAVDVITMRAGRLVLAPNVRVWSVGKERGWGEAHRATEFYRLLLWRLSAQPYSAAFAHMMPVFAAMAAPLLTARGIPMTLWYTHRARSRMLALAVRGSRRIVTAVPDSFPIATPKLRAIGHGIDTSIYQPAAAPGTGSAGAGIIQVARLMPIKRQDALIEAVAALPGVRLTLIGDAPAGAGAEAYAARLRAQVQQLGLGERVRFAGVLLGPRLLEACQRATLAVNLSPPGLFDKAALESMACGVPTLVANPAFAPLLGDDAPLLLCPDPTPAELAARLGALLALSEQARHVIGQRLRARVLAQHSLASLIPRLVNVLETGEPAGATGP